MVINISTLPDSLSYLFGFRPDVSAGRKTASLCRITWLNYSTTSGVKECFWYFTIDLKKTTKIIALAKLNTCAAERVIVTMVTWPGLVTHKAHTGAGFFTASLKIHHFLRAVQWTERVVYKPGERVVEGLKGAIYTSTEWLRKNLWRRWQCVRAYNSDMPPLHHQILWKHDNNLGRLFTRLLSCPKKDSILL